MDYKANNSGKGLFLKRLFPALEDLGVHCSYKDKKCDVALGISKWRHSVNAPRVLRVNGVALGSTKQDKWKNDQIRRSIKWSDAVIFQSKFSKKISKKILGVRPKIGHIIYNGANPKDYECEPVLSPYKKNVLMSARFADRKYKNLKGHLEYAANCKDSDTHFWLLGAEGVKNTHNLTSVGFVPEHKVREYLVVCDEMVYLALKDWCPNAVVEAIVAGLDVKFNPKLAVGKEFEALKREDLFIENIAKQYKGVFDSVAR